MRPRLEAALQAPSRLGDTCVEFAVGGGLDMAASFRIEHDIDGLLDRQRVRRLVLNFADVGFIDSAGRRLPRGGSRRDGRAFGA